MVHAPWDQLQIEISGLIFERLDLEDRIRFNLVCKQWSKNTKQTPQPLWLMLPYEPNNKYLNFFDMCDGKVLKWSLPESVQGGWFCGCSKGWLFLALGTTLANLQIFLFDPITRVQIPLPPLSTISNFEDCFTYWRSEWNRNPAAYIIDEVEPSSSDVSQCIVAAKLSEEDSTLVLCRPGDERWTIVKGLLVEGYIYGSIIFFDGELYASIVNLKEEYDNNQAPLQIHSVMIGSQRVNLKLIYSSTSPPRFLCYAQEKLLCLKDLYRTSCLVESKGQLLMVTQTWDAIEEEQEEEDKEGPLGYIQASTFQVFKIQKTTQDTVCITRLTHLDKQSLFLGIGGCVARENLNQFHKNCIYFLQVLDYRAQSDKARPYVCREAGVYHLDDGSIKRCFPSIPTKSCSYMHWFSPNINLFSLNGDTVSIPL